MWWGLLMSSHSKLNWPWRRGYLKEHHFHTDYPIGPTYIPATENLYLKKKRVWKLKTCTNRHMYITFLQIKNSIKLYTWKIYITKDKHTDHFTMHLTRVGIGPKQKDLKSDTYDKMTPNIHPSTLFVSCGVCITFSTFDDKAFFLFLNYYWIFTDPPTPV